MTALYGPSTRPEGFPVLPDAIRTVPFQQVTGPDTGRQYAALAALAVTSADTYPVPVVTPEPQPARAARRMSRNDKLLLAGIYVALIAANVAIFPPLRHEVMAGYDRAWPGVLAVPVAGAAVLGWRARSRVRAFAVALAGAAPWPLLAVLTVQAVLSLRLVWSNTAFPDEALYLWAGHLEWAHWLHGAHIPAFSTYLSGAPVVYPPLGALVDSQGGLAAARALSLMFMLAATILLHGVSRRIFGRRAANFAAGLFVGTAAIQFLGAFATYDALALMLLALATWLGVRAADTGPARQLLLILGAGVTLALADATKYAAALFDPVVVTVITLAVWRKLGRAAGIGAGMTVFWVLYVSLFTGVHLGGNAYWQGITTTTLTRAQGGYPASFLLFVSGKWVGLVALLAVIGAVAVTWGGSGRITAILAGVLATAVFLVPAEQARIHTYTSLFKHLGYGTWFGCIVAGYALAGLVMAVPRTKAVNALRAGVAAVVIVSLPSIPWAPVHFGWPNASQLIPVARRILATTHGPVLADDRGNVLDYYIPGRTRHRQMLGTFFFAYNDPVTGRHLTGKNAYAAAIRNRYFSMVMLDFWDTTATDRDIKHDIRTYRGYRLAAAIPYKATGGDGRFLIWVRKGPR